ncbi:MAG: hypothetical protein U9N61_02710 [Euryarchaeota archaeon]|nr:hypothetical protein [Euryarchaeota archaeon]
MIKESDVECVWYSPVEGMIVYTKAGHIIPIGDDDLSSQKQALLEDGDY